MCENADHGGSHCEDRYNCCDCGGNYPGSNRGDDWDCGCNYCWSCNACEECLEDD